MGITASAHSNSCNDRCHPYGVLELFLRKNYNHFTPTEFASETASAEQKTYPKNFKREIVRRFISKFDNTYALKRAK